MFIFMKHAKITWIVLRGKSEIAYWKGCFENCIYELPVIVADICFREAKYVVQYVMSYSKELYPFIILLHVRVRFSY